MSYSPEVFATWAAALSVMAFLPYVWAILRGNAAPQRSSWFIWSVLSALAFAAVWSAGGETGLLFTGAQAGGTALVFLLSIWRGTGRIWNRSEAFILTLAGSGLVLWWFTDDPVYALALSIGIGAAGGVLTVTKAYSAPRSEALSAWALHTLAAFFGVASVLGGQAIELAYPVYLLCLYTAILAAGLAGRAAWRAQPPRVS